MGRVKNSEDSKTTMTSKMILRARFKIQVMLYVKYLSTSFKTEFITRFKNSGYVLCLMLTFRRDIMISSSRVSFGTVPFFLWCPAILGQQKLVNACHSFTYLVNILVYVHGLEKMKMAVMILNIVITNTRAAQEPFRCYNAFESGDCAAAVDLVILADTVELLR
ncbi:hypothetical protein BC833DRAFT_642030 [Globomyces pollinis-pini]|nr:hypothetical protein BC833DRAFT_642030 [Globomyces pollinis-pini]